MRVWLRTFGCRANQADTETVRAMIESSGGEIVDAPEAADVAVYNGCTVTTQAEAELRRTIRRTARRAPQLRSIVTGCAASLSPARGQPLSLYDLPTVDRVVDGGDFAAVAGALELPPAASLTVAHRQSGTRALLRIQDGCDEHCTFCATTLARGGNRSRPAASLLDEAARLAEHHREIVLTGIHIGSYGLDIGTTLGELVESLISRVPGARLRLSSIEATELDERLRALFAARPQHLVPHLHAPLQSGSDRVLRRMGRHWYTAAAYEDAVRHLIGSRRVFALGADVIAGFPGETEADHEATLALIERLPFSYLHVFPYSPRPGTAATRIGGAVDPATVARRAAELRAAASRAAAAYRASRAGGEADVIVLGGAASTAAGGRTGLTEDYLSVLIEEPLSRGARIRMRLAGSGDALSARTMQGAA